MVLQLTRSFNKNCFFTDAQAVEYKYLQKQARVLIRVGKEKIFKMEDGEMYHLPSMKAQQNPATPSIMIKIPDGYSVLTVSLAAGDNWKRCMVRKT